MVAVLLGMNRCCSFPLLSATHSLFNIWTDLNLILLFNGFYEGRPESKFPTLPQLLKTIYCVKRLRVGLHDRVMTSDDAWSGSSRVLTVAVEWHIGNVFANGRKGQTRPRLVDFKFLNIKNIPQRFTEIKVSLVYMSPILTVHSKTLSQTALQVDRNSCALLIFTFERH